MPSKDLEIRTKNGTTLKVFDFRTQIVLKLYSGHEMCEMGITLNPTSAQHLLEFLQKSLPLAESSPRPPGMYTATADGETPDDQSGPSRLSTT